jgi:hypothetical protein
MRFTVSENDAVMNPHAKRLQDAMAEIRRRGYFTRLEPPFILIQTRRLLEDTKSQNSFPVAVLYADWCAHTRLDRTGAAAVLLKITEGLNRHVRDSSNASIDAVYDAVRSALAVRTLQSELVNLYGRFGVETSALVAPQMVRQFIGAILDTVAGLPLEFPKDVGQKRDKVRKIYDAACRIARNDPQWIVNQCSVTNELSSEQL